MNIIILLLVILKPTFGQNMTSGTENWTSCEEFLQNSTFDHHKVVDIDWKIFYFWNYANEHSYHVRFSLAAPILVDRFKADLSKVDPTIDWSRAVLFMETSIDFSALYIETETSGMFRLIPSLAFQTDKIPMLLFALKLVDPGYLGIVNCQHRLCYALAPVDQMPNDDDLNMAAGKIGFYGNQNRSHLSQYDRHPPLAPYLEDDSDDDEQVEIDNDPFPNEL